MSSFNLVFSSVSSYQYCAAAVFLLIFGLYFFLLSAPSRDAKVPGPDSPMEVLANFGRILDWCTEMQLRHKKTWGICLPRIAPYSHAFVLTDPLAVKHVLKDNFKNYEKGSNFRDQFGDFLGKGIFASDGRTWEIHRKIASNMFSRNLLRVGSGIAESQGQRLLDRIEKSLREIESKVNNDVESANTATVVDIQDLFFRFTMDVFCEIAFGVKLGSMDTEHPHPFAQAFDRVQAHCMQRMMDMFWKYKMKLWPLFASERKLKRDVKQIDEFARSVISSKRRVALDQNNLGPDLLSRFLSKRPEANKKSQGSSSNSLEYDFNDNELRDIVMNFIIAGRDTTACALSWMVYELCCNPEVKKRVEAEALAVGVWSSQAQHATTAQKCDYSYDTVAKCKYLQAVVAEVLRLHPSVPKDMKFAIKDDVLPDGTNIPAGAQVAYIPYAMGRDPALWTDPLKFNPDRWINEDGQFVEPSSYKFIAFNGGPRLCLGKPLAYLEIKLMTLMLMHKYTYTLINGDTPRYCNTLVLSMIGGLPVEIKRK